MKVHLREWRKEEAELLATLANNKKIADNMRDLFPHPYTTSDAMKWIADNETKIPPTTFAIEVDGAFAGGCGIHRSAERRVGRESRSGWSPYD